MSPSVVSKKPKILALTYPNYAGKDYMEEFELSHEIHIVGAKDRETALPAIAEKVASSGPFDAFVVLMNTKPYGNFDEEFITPLLPDLKIFTSASAGYNEFDVDFMTEHSIYFCNSRAAVSEATADMTIFLLLAVLKDTTRAEKSARSGLWRNDHGTSVDPDGLTLGIVGLGGIGKHVARKAAVFNLKVQYYNRTQLPAEIEKQFNVTYCPSLESLLRTSDIVSIHTPQNAGTEGLISTKEFAQMKDGVFFINTSRGPVVDEDALIAALESGKVRRAGLDVFKKEPVINEYFKKSDKCTIQPHLGGLTNIAWMKAERECIENLRQFFKTGYPVAPVNDLRNHSKLNPDLDDQR